MATGKTSIFKGLNNVTDPVRLGLGWMVQADNVDITATGAVKQRDGYSRSFAGAMTAAFSTQDFSRLFVVDGGILKAMNGPAAAVPLMAGLVAAPMYFTEINQQVFFNNGVQSGVILQDNEVAAWSWPVPDAPMLLAVTGSLPAGTYRACCTFLLADGRETGASDAVELVLAAGSALQVSGIPQKPGMSTRVYIAPADSTVFQHGTTTTSAAYTWNQTPDYLGVDLNTYGMSPLPAAADIVQAWKGRIYASQYLQAQDQTVVWFSQPLGYHLFDLAKDFFIIQGRVSMLAPTDEALIVGTNTSIHAYTADALTQLAPYGVVPGYHWSKDTGRTLFWSKRGLCAALPFVNLTERHVSVPPGLHAGGALVERDGRKQYLVALHKGGVAFNSLT